MLELCHVGISEHAGHDAGPHRATLYQPLSSILPSSILSRRYVWLYDVIMDTDVSGVWGRERKGWGTPGRIQIKERFVMHDLKMEPNNRRSWPAIDPVPGALCGRVIPCREVSALASCFPDP